MVSPPSHILLAADDAITVEPIADTLRRDGHIAIVCTSPERTLSTLKRQMPQLAVVWLQLPDATTGFDLIRATRADDNPIVSGLPLIAVDLAASELNCLQTFQYGADDYVDAACSPLQLRARIDGLLRRSRPARQNTAITFGNLTIDSETHTASMAGCALSLSRKEFELLHQLASQPGRVFTKGELLRNVWHYPPNSYTRTLDSHASRLRRKLLAASTTPRIENIWGIGYRLTGNSAKQQGA